MSSSEQYYIRNRALITEKSIYDIFAATQIPGFDYHNFWLRKSKPIQLALVLSGGGFRSMLTGAGVLQAYDDRKIGKGNLKGLLQSITYFGGISGGAWLVMSNFVNDFKPIHLVIADKDWSMQTQVLEGIPNFDPKNLATYQKSLFINNNTIIPDKKSWYYLLKKYFSPDFKVEDSEQNDSTIIEYLKKTLLNKSLLLKENSKDAYNKLTKTLRFYNELHLGVLRKKAAGFPVSLTDYWGIALSKKLFISMKQSPGLTLTSCTQLPSFKSFEQPFPIICAVERDPTVFESHNESHLFEISPYEFGSWDSYLQTFMPMRYLGTPMFGGYSIGYDEITNKSMCVSGFDNVGFITATSSSLFNHAVSRLFGIICEFNHKTSSALENILDAFGITLNRTIKLDNSNPEYAIYSPNPFYGLKNHWSGNKERDITQNSNLYLVDGGDDGQNIPFHPFLRKERPIDVIIAYDMSSDVLNYPNGSSLMRTAKRYHNSNASIALPFFEINNSDKLPKIPTKQAVFPHVPTPKQFVDLSLNQQPIFFGCELSDYPIIQISSSKFIAKESPNIEYLPPLIIYQANTNHSFNSNTSSFKLTYTEDEVTSMITNGYNMATNKNSSFYHICVKCAFLKREFDRIQLGWNPHYNKSTFKPPSTCLKCFNQFCWLQK